MNSITFALKEVSKDRGERNGIAENRNRSIMDCAKTLMIEKNVVIKY